MNEWSWPCIMLFVGMLIAHPTVDPQTVASYWQQAETQAKGLPPDVAMTPIPWPKNSPWSWPAGTPGGIAQLGAPTTAPATMGDPTAAPTTIPTASWYIPTASPATPEPNVDPGDSAAAPVWTWAPVAPASTPTPMVPVPSSSSFPVYQGGGLFSITSLFYGNTPFHHTIAELRAAGGSDVPNAAQEMASVFCCGLGVVSGPMANTQPINIADGNTSSRLTITTTFASAINGMQVAFPSTMYSQQKNTDNHKIVVEMAGNRGELDLWGSTSPACAVSGNTVACANGGFYPFSDSGLAVDSKNRWSTGNAAGYAFGIFYVTAPDLLNATNFGRGPARPFGHALGVGLHCGSTSVGVYPSNGNRDNVCGALGGGTQTSTQGQQPAPRYGDVLYLKPTYQIPANATVYCQSVVLTLQEKGAYFFDTGPYQSNGMALALENPIDLKIQGVSDAQNPWYTTIQPAMSAAGEGSQPGPNFSTSGCLQYVTDPADWSVFELKPGTQFLPPLKVAV